MGAGTEDRGVLWWVPQRLCWPGGRSTSQWVSRAQPLTVYNMPSDASLGLTWLLSWKSGGLYQTPSSQAAARAVHSWCFPGMRAGR